MKDKSQDKKRQKTKDKTRPKTKDKKKQDPDSPNLSLRFEPWSVGLYIRRPFLEDKPSLSVE